jgi:BirA family transcriptional regulator, biotin operon repressor / biotin---[acetyl-CoA-carboxylase] ligase
LIASNIVLEESISTNDDARRLAEAGCPHGTWISARRQTAGRGRLGRKWESLEGNLFLSIVARLPVHAGWSWVPLATAIAVAETLREFHPRLELEIKWPNDLWLNQAKVGGILCEAVGSGAQSYIVIGLGLNCAEAPEISEMPEGSAQPVTALSAAVPGLSADEVRLPVLAGILGMLEDLKREGPASLPERYERMAALRSGMSVVWSVPSATGNASGTVEGLGPSGELHVRNSEGKSLRLYAEDVRIRAVR